MTCVRASGVRRNVAGSSTCPESMSRVIVALDIGYIVEVGSIPVDSRFCSGMEPPEMAVIKDCSAPDPVDVDSRVCSPEKPDMPVSSDSSPVGPDVVSNRTVLGPIGLLEPLPMAVIKDCSAADPVDVDCRVCSGVGPEIADSRDCNAEGPVDVDSRDCNADEPEFVDSSDGNNPVPDVVDSRDCNADEPDADDIRDCRFVDLEIAVSRDGSAADADVVESSDCKAEDPAPVDSSDCKAEDPASVGSSDCRAVATDVVIVPMLGVVDPDDVMARLIVREVVFGVNTT